MTLGCFAIEFSTNWFNYSPVRMDESTHNAWAFSGGRFLPGLWNALLDSWTVQTGYIGNIINREHG